MQNKDFIKMEHDLLRNVLFSFDSENINNESDMKSVKNMKINVSMDDSCLKNDLIRIIQN